MKASSKRLIVMRENKSVSVAVALVKGTMESLFSLTEKLHPQEKEYYQTLKFDRRKAGYLLGRFSAKEALTTLTGIAEASSIFIDSGVFNFPIVRCVEIQNSQVSISHCGAISMSIAFEESHPMGIDLEKIQAKYRKVIRGQLTAKEHLLLTKNRLNNSLGYTVIWCIKESLSKVIKTGMTINFSLLEVDSIVMENGAYNSTFTHFNQYKAVSCHHGDYVVSVTLPKKSHADFSNVRFLFDIFLNPDGDDTL